MPAAGQRAGGNGESYMVRREVSISGTKVRGHSVRHCVIGTIGSQAGAPRRGGFPQTFRVAHRRRAEEPLVLTGELRGVAVPQAFGVIRSIVPTPPTATLGIVI